MSERKLNRKLIEKIIAKLETTPEAYDQNHWGRTSNEAPCGTAACVAGWACILGDAYTPKGLIRAEHNQHFRTIERKATKVLGVGGDLFSGSPEWDWPEPFNAQYERAKGSRGRARAAINLLKAILRTDGKILEG